MAKKTFLVLIIAAGIFCSLGADFSVQGGSATGNYSGPADLIPLILFLSLALGVSFLCSVLEAVLLSVGPGQVQIMIDEGKKSGLILKKLRSNLDRSLSAILTLNTVAHTAGAAGVGAEVARVFGNTYLALASIVLTLLVLVLSEIIPKTLGARNAKALAGKSAVLINWLTLLLLPIVLVLQGISYLLFGKNDETSYSRVELIAIAGLAGQEGNIDKGEAGMVQNLLRLKVLTVRDIMTPMTVVFSLTEDDSLAATAKQEIPNKYSRIPLKNKDGRLERYLKYNDLLTANQAEGADNQPVVKLAHPLTSIMDTEKVFDALKIVTDQRDKMLLVKNEFGQEIGIVTVEDIVETIAGKSIVDEDDEHARPRDHALQQYKDRDLDEQA